MEDDKPQPTKKSKTSSSSSNNNSLESTIIKLCRQYAETGLTSTILEQELGSIPGEKLLAAVNDLLQAGKIALLQDRSGTVLYREVTKEELSKFKGLTKEEMLLYQVISQAGNKGIWTKDIKYKTNLQQQQITKMMKVLESRKLVKQVPTTQKNKKVFMRYDLEPHPDVSGDVWYSQAGQEIDAEFIQILNHQVYKYITSKLYASTEEITAFIKKSGVSKVDLRIENIQNIIDTLIYDGKIEETEDPRGRSFLSGKGAVFYRPTKLDVIQDGYTSTPCGVCPVFDVCSDEGVITPLTCPYLKDWLDF